MWGGGAARRRARSASACSRACFVLAVKMPALIAATMFAISPSTFANCFCDAVGSGRCSRCRSRRRRVVSLTKSSIPSELNSSCRMPERIFSSTSVPRHGHAVGAALDAMRRAAVAVGVGDDEPSVTGAAA